MRLIIAATAAILLVVIAGVFLAQSIQPEPMEPSGPRPRLEVAVPAVDPCLVLDRARSSLAVFRQGAARCEEAEDCVYAKARCPVPINKDRLEEYQEKRAIFVQQSRNSQCERLRRFALCPPKRPGRILDCVSEKCTIVEFDLLESQKSVLKQPQN